MFTNKNKTEKRNAKKYTRILYANRYNLKKRKNDAKMNHRYKNASEIKNVVKSMQIEGVKPFTKKAIQRCIAFYC